VFVTNEKSDDVTVIDAANAARVRVERTSPSASAATASPVKPPTASGSTWQTCKLSDSN